MGLGKKARQSWKSNSLEMLAVPTPIYEGSRDLSMSCVNLAMEKGGRGPYTGGVSWPGTLTREGVSNGHRNGSPYGSYRSLFAAGGVTSMMMGLSLPGHEHPFAVQAAHNRHLENYLGDQKPMQLEFYIKKKPQAHQGKGNNGARYEREGRGKLRKGRYGRREGGRREEREGREGRGEDEEREGGRKEGRERGRKGRERGRKGRERGRKGRERGRKGRERGKTHTHLSLSLSLSLSPQWNPKASDRSERPGRHLDS